jgi:6,7-dimethyl-8-ribityllumazine synthase
MKVNKFNKLNGKSLKIAVVQARFNEKITERLAGGALKALKEVGVQKNNIEVFRVPGSFEIPIFCQGLAKSKRFHGIITIGAVIRGNTAHFEYISKAVTEGILRVSLDNSIPVTFGVITTYNIEQAKKRAGNNKNNKGYEAALALVELVRILERNK